MRFRLILFLMLCGCTFAADRGCIAGGSSSAAGNAGWFNDTVLDASACHNGSGANFNSSVGYATNSSGYVLITDSGKFTAALIGHYVNCDFDTMADGRYEVTARTDNTITINLAYSAEEAVYWTLGGAVPASYNVAAYDLEDVLDSEYCTATTNNVTIYATGTCDTAQSIMFDTREGVGNYWLSLVGCDTSYVPSVVGTQGFTITATAALHANSLIVIDDKERIAIKNVAFLDNDSDGGTPGDGENGITWASSAAQYGFLVENCSFNNVYRGIISDIYTNRLTIKDCSFGENEANTFIDVYIGGPVTDIQGGFWNSGYRGILCGPSAGVFINRSTFTNGTYGLVMGTSSGFASVKNCVYYKQTTAAILVNAAVAHANVSNSIFWVADPAADYAILGANSGSYIEYNNITNADTLALSGFVNSTAYNLDFSNDGPYDPFVDPVNGDFRINWGQTIANTYVIDKGYAPYVGASITGNNKANIGAWDYQQARPKAVRR